MRLEVIGIVFASAVVAAASAASAATPGGFNAVAIRELTPCPGFRINCVSSLTATADRHRVEPIRLASFGIGESGPLVLDKSWELVKAEVEKLPRVQIMEATDKKIVAQVRSRWFGFKDNVELVLSPVARRVHVRSSSNRSPLDFGANRRRVNRLRDQLQRIGIAE